MWNKYIKGLLEDPLNSLQEKGVSGWYIKKLGGDLM
jgi:hypothetical protein